MAKKYSSSSSPQKYRPALSPEADESQMISLAMDLVRKRLREGTASSQETTHFLKLGSLNAKCERENLILQNQLLKAKTDAIQSAAHSDELYQKALNSFRRYSGQDCDDNEEDDEEE